MREPTVGRGGAPPQSPAGMKKIEIFLTQPISCSHSPRGSPSDFCATSAEKWTPPPRTPSFLGC